MTHSETNTKTISLDEKDIKDAIKYYLKERGVNNFKAQEIVIFHHLQEDRFSASITITTSTEPK